MEICYICRTWPVRPGSEFCSEECEQLYKKGKRWVMCRFCGREFSRAPSAHTTKCFRCVYADKYSSLKKKEPEAKEDKIIKIIEEQTKIKERTGRHLSYGQIMSGRAYGKK